MSSRSGIDGGKPGSVLVVDDEAFCRQTCRLMLEAAGYEVHEAEDGPGAVQELERRPYDVVLTDLVMPGSPDGRGLLALAPRYPETRLVVMSAYNGWPDTCPFPVFLQKPFTYAELLAMVGDEPTPAPAPEGPPAPAPEGPPAAPREETLASPPPPSPEVGWHPVCRAPDGLPRDRFATELAAKAVSHRLLFRAPDPYVEVMVGRWIAFVEWQPPRLTVRRIVAVPTTDREIRWFQMFQDYTRVYRLPYRREVEPGGDEARLEKGLAQARGLLARLAEDLDDYVRRYEPEPRGAALARFVRESVARAERDAELLPASALVVRVEEVLCGVHSALDALVTPDG